MLKSQFDHSRTNVFHRITLDSSEEYLSFIFKRRWFPLKPAFAFTINKSEGQTLEKIGLDLKNSCSSHGQLYVALSRITNPSNLIINVDTSRYKENIAYADNIVFQEVFDDKFISIKSII
jgi:hypothetical protein